MPDALGPGSTFAGCRIEAVAGRGGMGVVYRATQLALQRSVAVKAIAPDFDADEGFRRRFEREAHLTASIDHPNVIPVYEAGESEGTLYLIMRWIDGLDLRELLKTSGRLSPERAVTLLRPVASALAAAHRRGLVHRDVKPANVLIARGDAADDDHVYLTDFGIARRDDGESVTRTGVFVGTVEYTAPERLQGGKGDASSDIYSFGCLLFEALTGHVPYERPTRVATIFAHVSDPIPSARAEAPEVPESLDAVIAKAMAKTPGERYPSAAELAVALSEALDQPSDGDPKARSERGAATQFSGEEQEGPTGLATPDTAEFAATTPAVPPRATAQPETRLPRPTVPTVPVNGTVDQPSTTPASPPAIQARAPARPRRSPFLWVVPVLVVATAVVLVATLSDNPNHRSGSSSGSSSGSPGVAAVTTRGGGLTVGRTITLPGAPSSVTIGLENVWASVPTSGQLVRINSSSGDQSVFPARGRPSELAAGTKALWVTQAATHNLAQFNGDTGGQVALVDLPGAPVALALDPGDSTAWVADSTGAITHAGFDGAVIGTAAHTDPAPTALARGEGWLWGVNGTIMGLVRVSPDSSGATTTFAVGQRPVGVTLDRGVWIADASGHVLRFDPRLNRLRVNAQLAVAPELDAIAATDPGQFVWAMSARSKAVYRITNQSRPAVTGGVRFTSTPIALAVRDRSLWVATQDGKVTEIRF